MNTIPKNEDTKPIVAIQPIDIRGKFGLWRLQQAGAKCGQLVAPMGRSAVVTVGRDRDAAAFLADATVSRLHCRVVLDESGVPGRGPWLVEDLGARNGTWVGLDRLPPNGRATITAGQTLRVGAVLLWLGDGNDEDLGPLGQLIPGFSLGRAHMIRRLNAMLERNHPIVMVGPYGAGRRAVVSALVESVRGQARAEYLPLNDVEAWHQAFSQQPSAAPKHASAGPKVLVAGAIEMCSPDVQKYLALRIQEQAAWLAAGAAPTWRFVGWASPAALPFASARDPLVPELRRALGVALVELDRLDRHREDISAIVEAMRRKFEQPSLQELAAINADHAAEVCAQVQRWAHQGWPADVAELAAMALPNHDAEDVLRSGLPAAPGTWVSSEKRPAPAATKGRSERPSSAGFTKEASESTDLAEWASSEETRGPDWFAVAMSDPVTLERAINLQFAGNIRAFCEEAGAVQSRNPESVRRQVYRHLGERLRAMRT